MSRTKLVIAMAAAALVIPAFAQTQPAPMASEKVGQETPAVKRTPEQIAKDKATKEKVRADARKANASGEKAAADQVGQAKPAKKKTPEQIAADKAAKAKRGTTPEEQAKQGKTLPGG